MCNIDEKISVCHKVIGVSYLVVSSVYPLEKARHGGTLAESKA
jgi:hypothetical protein